MLEKMMEKPIHSIIFIIAGTAILNGMLIAGYRAGILPSTGIILGAAAFFIAWAATRQFIARDNEKAKKWLNLIFIILFFVSGFGQATYHAYSKFVAPRHALTSEALENRSIEMDTRASIGVNSVLARAQRSLARSLQKVDRQFSQAIHAKAKAILAALGENPSPGQIDRAITQINYLTGLVRDRKKLLERAFNNIIKEKKKNDATKSESKWFAWFNSQVNRITEWTINTIGESIEFKLFVLALIFLLVAVLCRNKLDFPGRKGLAKTGGIIIFVIFLAWWFPGAANSVKNFGGTLLKQIQASAQAETVPSFAKTHFGSSSGGKKRWLIQKFSGNPFRVTINGRERICRDVLVVMTIKPHRPAEYRVIQANDPDKFLFYKGGEPAEFWALHAPGDKPLIAKAPMM